MGSDNKTDVPTFSDRHPRLYFLLGILLLLLIGGGSVFVINAIVNYIVIGIKITVDWLSSLASKLDAVVIVALITGSVSIIGVLISSVIAKRIEYKRSRQEYLAKKREEPYGQFVDMIYKL